MNAINTESNLTVVNIHSKINIHTKIYGIIKSRRYLKKYTLHYYNKCQSAWTECKFLIKSNIIKAVDWDLKLN